MTNDSFTVGIDVRELTNRPAGKGQYLGRLLNVWLSIDQKPSVNFVFYLKNETTLPSSYNNLIKRAGKRVKIVYLPGRGPLWHLAVSRHLSHDSVNVYFAALSYQSAIFNRVPTVTVVHDLAVFKLKNFIHNRQAELTEKLSLQFCLRSSREIIAVSENTANDLRQLSPVINDKLKVISEAPLLADGKNLELIAISERKPYFLFVGTLEPRKNILTLLTAYSLLSSEIRTQYRLKLVGKKGWGNENYVEMTRELDIEEQVDFLGYVEDESLIDLYRQAKIFIYPSLYEGFGLPVVESMACGTPVVASNTASIPEILGDNDWVCDPDKPLDFASKIEALVNDDALWTKISIRVQKRSKLFSWQKVSSEIMADLAIVASTC